MTLDTLRIECIVDRVVGEHNVNDVITDVPFSLQLLDKRFIIIQAVLGPGQENETENIPIYSLLGIPSRKCSLL